MKLDTLTAGNVKVSEILEGGRVVASKTVTVEAASVFVPATVVIDHNGSDHQFQLGGDGQWRLCSTSTWGNYEGVYGEACGASGFVVRDADAVDSLDWIVS